MNKRHTQGFTLLEILVAMAIFSSLAYLTYGGMQKIFKSSEVMQVKSARLDEIQFAFSVMSNDLQQVVDRPIRGRLGDREAAFLRRPDNDIFLSLTTQIKSPWQLQSQSSSLQRVDYRWVDGVLYRDVWPVLDRAHNTEPISQVLIEEMNEFNIEFLYDRTYEFWPVPASSGEYPSIPPAINIVMSLNDLNTINKVFLLGQL